MNLRDLPNKTYYEFMLEKKNMTYKRIHHIMMGSLYSYEYIILQMYFNIIILFARKSLSSPNERILWSSKLNLNS